MWCMPSYLIPLVDRGIPFATFERKMLHRRDTMTHEQKDHYEFRDARFQHLDDQVEGPGEYCCTSVWEGHLDMSCIFSISFAFYFR